MKLIKYYTDQRPSHQFLQCYFQLKPYSHCSNWFYLHELIRKLIIFFDFFISPKLISIKITRINMPTCLKYNHF